MHHHPTASFSFLATSSPRRPRPARAHTACVPSIASALPRPMHIFFGKPCIFASLATSGHGHRNASGATMAPDAYGLFVGIGFSSAEDNPRFSLGLLSEPFHSVPSRRLHGYVWTDCESPRFWIHPRSCRSMEVSYSEQDPVSPQQVVQQQDPVSPQQVVQHHC